jgi:hypothetical protein
MRDRREPAVLGDVLRTILDRLGVGDLDLWDRICREWSDVVGAPWDRQSKPVALADGILTVEAVTPAAIGVLRYGTKGLVRTLCNEYGEGVVVDVRLRPPDPRNRG